MGSMGKSGAPSAGELIKQGRTKLNLTQEQFARLIDVTSSTISRWERHLQLPQPEERVKLAKILSNGRRTYDPDDFNVNPYKPPAAA